MVPECGMIRHMERKDNRDNLQELTPAEHRRRLRARKRAEQIRRRRMIIAVLAAILFGTVFLTVQLRRKISSHDTGESTVAAAHTVPEGSPGGPAATQSSGPGGEESASGTDETSSEAPADGTDTEAGSEVSAGDAGTSESTDAAAAETPGAVQENTGSAETADFFSGYTVHTAPSVAAALTGEGMSDHAVLINVNTGEIVAGKNWEGPIVPASMTKILTVLVAAEHLGPAALDEPFTVTIDDTDYSYRNDGSAAGFGIDETVTVRDLFYGTILPSGADAASALARRTASSREAFADLMNQKLAELGLADTAHFTNCVGLYDAGHYCTLTDMAMILKAAVENDICREVLSAHTWTTTATEQHPEGITISNWFLRRIEDKDTHGEVRCAKTGFVKESRNCAASWHIASDGTDWICVTAGAHSAWRCIYDHVDIYQKFTQ